jgi:uncharacterized protein DUF1579
MKKLLIFLGCVIAVLILITSRSLAQSKTQEEQMKAWQEYMTPSDMHKMLAKDEGEWKADITMWMDPKAPPTKSTGSNSVKMIMGGRYQESRFKGDFMGMPMEGVGTVAYDNGRKVFISTWYDNMGTGLMYMEGKYDPATKSILFEGDGYDPTTGKNCKMREVYKYIDDKTQVMEMYNTPAGGTEVKSMEIKFTKL